MRVIYRYGHTHAPLLDALVTDAHKTGEMISKACTLLMLLPLENRINLIAAHYKALYETPYWINKLQTIMLLRRCELLAIQYPENEEA